MNAQKEIVAQLQHWLAQHAIEGKLAPFHHTALASDSTLKLLLRDNSGKPAGFVLCSSRSAPDLIQRGVDRARRARELLGDDLGQVILEPSQSGDVEGLSFALFPYCKPLSDNRILRSIQRRGLAPDLLGWLREVTRATVTCGSEDNLTTCWEPVLDRIGQERFAREIAMSALAPLRNGQMGLKFVLAHYDLWLGNVLRAPRRSRRSFVIIDWLGADVKGHALFDLIRLAESLGTSPRDLCAEIDAHCAILECDRAQAGVHLLAALGRIGLNLEQFPRERFTAMAESCWRTFTAACAR